MAKVNGEDGFTQTVKHHVTEKLLYRESEVMRTADYDANGDAIVDKAAQQIIKGTLFANVDAGDPVFLIGLGTSNGTVTASFGRAQRNNKDYASGCARTSGSILDEIEVVSRGFAGGIDTTAWLPRTLLYLAETGGLTDTPDPTPGAYNQRIGYVGSQEVNGVIVVDASIGFVSGVDTTPPPAAFVYAFRTATDSSTFTGQAKRNNSDPVSTSQLYINATDASGVDRSVPLSNIAALDNITYQATADGDNNVFQATGASSLSGTTYTVPVTFVSQSGTLADNEQIAVEIT